MFLVSCGMRRSVYERVISQRSGICRILKENLSGGIVRRKTGNTLRTGIGVIGKLTALPFSLSGLMIKPDLSYENGPEKLKAAAPAYTKVLVDFIISLVNSLSILLRGFCLFIIFTPVIVSSPLLISQRTYGAWIEILMKSCEMAGPVFLKLCQWASTRRDIFPEIVCDKLSRLQRHTSPHSWDHTFQILQERYDGRYDQVFHRFDMIPVGSGCCAQVYRGSILEEGREVEVAIKVVHPGLQQHLTQDLAVMSSSSRFLTWLIPSLTWLNLEQSVAEFGQLMTGQVDLVKEADHLEKFIQNFENEERINFPRPIRALSSSDILVETWAPGIPISLLMKDDTPSETKLELAHLGVGMLLKMVFKDNYWHGDLHPGNILVSQTSQGPILNVLDAGISADLTREDRRNLVETFRAIVKGDGKRVGELFLDRSSHECHDRSGFLDEMEKLVLKARGKQLTLDRIDVSELLKNTFSILLRYKVRLDSSFSSLVLAVIVLEGLGRSLDPSLDLLTRAIPYLALPV